MSVEAGIDAVVGEALGRQAIVGSVIIVAKGGEPIYRKAAGWFDREERVPMREDAIFRLASFTKPLVAAMALALVEQGRLSLEAPVTAYLPHFTPPGPDGRPATIIISHLLAHTGGIVGGGPAFDAAGVGGGLADTDLWLDENLRRLATVPLAHRPGEGWVYGKGLDVLGGVIAAVDGPTLGESLARHVTGPLGLADTGFTVSDRTRLGPVYADNPGAAPIRMVGTHDVPQRDGPGTVTFTPDRVFNPQAFQSGGSGGVGTAPDFFRFLETLRMGGRPILGRRTVTSGTQNLLGAVLRQPGSGFGHFGAVVTDPVAARTPQPAGTYEWGGVYGHRWFVDPINAITAVIMTNTAIEGCSGPFPLAVRDAIYSGFAG